MKLATLLNELQSRSEMYKRQLQKKDDIDNVNVEVEVLGSHKKFKINRVISTIGGTVYIYLEDV